MRLLLDTHILIWVSYTPWNIDQEALTAIQNQDNLVFYSAASMLEIAIKNSTHSRDFHVNINNLERGLIDHGYDSMDIKASYATTLEELPLIHKDPFDRMLIAQAICENCLLVTSDKIIKQYELIKQYDFSVLYSKKAV